MAPASFSTEQARDGGMLLGLRRGEVRLVAHQPGWLAAHPGDRTAYTAAKAAFIQRVLA